MLYRSAYDHQRHCVANAGTPPSGDGGNGEQWAELDAAFEELVRNAHKGKNRGVNQRTVAERAKILTAAMLEGYGKNLADVDYDTPDGEMLRRLRENVWAFSGATDEQMTKDLSAALLDADGRLRSENDFFREAAKVGKIYNRDRLRVERNHAVGTGQMAARWAEFQQDRDVAPNLRYRTVGDGRVRDSHRALDNIVRPMDDPFWNTYYPPNDWGCRCSVQAEDGRTTEIEGKPLPVLKPMFRTNLAASGVLYPEGHPYMERSTVALLSFNRANYVRDAVRKGKGAVYESGMALDPTKTRDVRHYRDYLNKMDVANTLADYLDREVYVTPELHSLDWRYGYFFDNAPVPGKKPDFRIGNEYWELEGYEGKFKPKKIKDMIESGARQSDHVVIKVRADLLERVALKQVTDYYKREKAVKPKRVIVIDRNNRVLVDHAP